jgi:feruloyl-CoA synthase
LSLGLLALGETGQHRAARIREKGQIWADRGLAREPLRGQRSHPRLSWRPEKSAATFDQEGFFLMGDVVRFLKLARPERGLAFDGRIAEQLNHVTAMQQVAAVLAVPALVRAVREGLLRHNAVQQGSSTRIERFKLLEKPPSIEGREITEKGYVNQRVTLERRSAIVERLYGGSEAAGVHDV